MSVAGDTPSLEPPRQTDTGNVSTADQVKADEANPPLKPLPLKRYNLLAAIFNARSSNGVSIQEYGQYRSYCGRKVRRLRRMIKGLDFKKIEPKKKKQKKKLTKEVQTKSASHNKKRRVRRRPLRIKRVITPGFHPSLNFVKLCVFEAERLWAQACRIEHLIRTESLRTNAYRRHIIRRRLYLAWRKTLSCFFLCFREDQCRCIDQRSLAELRIYGCYLKGRYYVLCRKVLKGLEILAEGQIICHRIRQDDRDDAADKQMAMLSDLIRQCELSKKIANEEKQKAKTNGLQRGRELVAKIWQLSERVGEDVTVETIEQTPQRFKIHQNVFLDIEGNDLLFRIKDVTELLDSDKTIQGLLLGSKKRHKEQVQGEQSLDLLTIRLNEAEDSLRELVIQNSSQVVNDLIWIIAFVKRSIKLVGLLDTILESFEESVDSLYKLYRSCLPCLSEALKQQSFVDQTFSSIFKPEVSLKLIEFCLQLWGEISLNQCPPVFKPHIAHFQYHSIDLILRNCKAFLLAILLSFEGEIDKSYVMCNLVSQRVSEFVPASFEPTGMEDGKSLALSLPFWGLMKKAHTLDQVIYNYAVQFQSLFVTTLLDGSNQSPFPKPSPDKKHRDAISGSKYSLVYPKPFMMDLAELLNDEAVVTALSQCVTETTKPEVIPTRSGGLLKRLFG